jgi:hypothetical protein
MKKNNNSGSKKLRELLEQMNQQNNKYQETELDDEDFFVNSMQLFSDIEAQINFEDDVGKLKDLSLYWINLILRICPDEAATAIAKRAMKEGSIRP